MGSEQLARIDVRLSHEEEASVFDEIRAGLLDSPRRISSRFLYDDEGSRLFEKICELPEYYQTRTEARILQSIADEVVSRTKAEELVELGSGSSTKTRILLDAMQRRNQLRRYIPLDVSEGIVRRAAEELIDSYQGLGVHAVIADFMSDLQHFPTAENQLVIFLGSTIGNLQPNEAVLFLQELAAHMDPNGHLLIGTDLIKETSRLQAAYDDSRGVTAAFNKNSLNVLNDLLDGNFDPSAFDHVARYSEAQHRIEMWLRASRRQSVWLRKADLSLEISEADEILTEISIKYDRARVRSLLDAAGFEMEAWYTDPENLFGVSLSRVKDSWEPELWVPEIPT